MNIEFALNTSGEIDILRLILGNIKHHNDLYQRKIDLIILANKCDDMIYRNDSLHFSKSDDEYDEMFDQIVNTITTEKNNLDVHIDIPILPISAEDAFIYRTAHSMETGKDLDIDEKYIHKLGINEYGKTRWNKNVQTNDDFQRYKRELLDTLKNKNSYDDHMRTSGFEKFKEILNLMIDKNSENYFHSRLNYIITGLPIFDKQTYKKYIESAIEIINKEEELNWKYEIKYTTMQTILYDLITDYFEKNIKFEEKIELSLLVCHTYEQSYKAYLNNLNEIITMITFIENALLVYKNLPLIKKILNYLNKKNTQIKNHKTMMAIYALHNLKLNYAPEIFERQLQEILTTIVDNDLSFMENLSTKNRDVNYLIVNLIIMRRMNHWISHKPLLNTLVNTKTKELINFIKYIQNISKVYNESYISEALDKRYLATFCHNVLSHKISNLSQNAENLLYLLELENKLTSHLTSKNKYGYLLLANIRIKLNCMNHNNGILNNNFSEVMKIYNLDKEDLNTKMPDQEFEDIYFSYMKELN